MPANAPPRPEYPRPSFVRADWLNLNGSWSFEMDRGNSGEERGLLHRDLNGHITVPFCPESELSGIGEIDFLNAVWYRRGVDVPADWKGRRVLLHFQAVDDEATVWLTVGDAEPREVAVHRGGHTPFTCDLGDVGGQRITLTLRARDDHREHKPKGKQSGAYANAGCHYTRTTGIWQTVWLEPVPMATRLDRPRVWPDVANGCFHVELPLTASGPGPHAKGLRVRAVLRDSLDDSAGELVTAGAGVADFLPRLTLAIPEEYRRLWSPDDPHLYGLRVELLDADGTTLDAADTYAGLRSVTLDGRAFRLNGESLFQRLVLDQGYYPDGLLTAPSDEALVRDIQLSMAAGFNGARLHQKVFEERFLYHADRLGYLVWGEFADWGLGARSSDAQVIEQWVEAMHRDLSHPSIVGWCPLNEQQPQFWSIGGNEQQGAQRLRALQAALYGVTKAIDPTRPTIDVSGGSHLLPCPDTLDTHDYEQDPAKFAEHYAGIATGELHTWGNPRFPATDRGQPYFVSEFGGAWWEHNADDTGEDRKQSWGYGQRPQSVDEFLHRFEGLCTALLQHPHIFGYCYTQLTDVFQEQNGVLTFDREPKFDLDTLHAIQSKPAAIEA